MKIYLVYDELDSTMVLLFSIEVLMAPEVGLVSVVQVRVSPVHWVSCEQKLNSISK